MAKREIPKIKVEPRPRIGSRYATRLRKGGQLPAVIYGHKKDPVHVAVNEEEMHELLHRNTHLLEVMIDSRSEPCLVRDVQWDHMGSEILHVDLARVDLNERVTVEVELVLTGDAVGLKEVGAFIEQQLKALPVQCLVTEIPDNIKVDVGHLKVDESVTVGQIKLPEGVTTKTSPDAIVAAIHIVKEEIVEVVAPEAGSEPEVIGKKLEEGAEGEAAAAPAAGGAKKEAAPKKDDKK
ncbi:MAG: 50S ribosomal protein L25 [Planctomycetes bacterium]|nr:50S ribosomal protein L25 [Planctomycetota bacterium]